MTATLARRTLTTSELACSLRCSAEYVEALLAESVEAGFVERTPAGWRLSEWAERRFGRALRGLAGWST